MSCVRARCCWRTCRAWARRLTGPWLPRHGVRRRRRNRPRSKRSAGPPRRGRADCRHRDALAGPRACRRAHRAAARRAGARAPGRIAPSSGGAGGGRSTDAFALHGTSATWDSAGRLRRAVGRHRHGCGGACIPWWSARRRGHPRLDLDDGRLGDPDKWTARTQRNRRDVIAVARRRWEACAPYGVRGRGPATWSMPRAWACMAILARPVFVREVRSHRTSRARSGS